VVKGKAEFNVSAEVVHEASDLIALSAKQKQGMVM
jgi:hypothetical protein